MTKRWYGENSSESWDRNFCITRKNWWLCCCQSSLCTGHVTRCGHFQLAKSQTGHDSDTIMSAVFPPCCLVWRDTLTIFAGGIRHSRSGRHAARSSEGVLVHTDCSPSSLIKHRKGQSQAFCMTVQMFRQIFAISKLASGVRHFASQKSMMRFSRVKWIVH